MAPGDLPKRLGVAVLGIPAVLILLYFGGWFLAVPLAALAAVGAREVSDMARARGIGPFDSLALPATAGLVLLANWAGAWGPFAGSALLVLMLLAGASLFTALAFRSTGGAPLGAVAVTLFSTVYLGLSLATVPFLHALPTRLEWGGAAASPWMGAAAVALPLAATWVGDSAAYFGGSAWGRHGPKLAPSISPNKSWIGTACGLVGSALAVIVWRVVVGGVFPEGRLPDLAMAGAIGIVLGIGAQVGDLAESMLKREAGVKDSGSLFPGHGGALDRLDALVVTLPLSYALLLLAGAIG